MNQILIKASFIIKNEKDIQETIRQIFLYDCLNLDIP